ncbi:MAG TPA: hypothetical protein VFX37_10065 [Pseudolabrys sp.]|nr:hypothetical protein [Pseudolabrys sp.]
MHKLFAAVFFSAALVSTTTQAGSWHRVSPGIILPVAGGCGIGVHRGPFNGCNVAYRPYRHAYYRGYVHGYRDGYLDDVYGHGPAWLVDQGACSGLKPYLICAPGGPCWADCYGRVELGW